MWVVNFVLLFVCLFIATYVTLLVSPYSVSLCPCCTILLKFFEWDWNFEGPFLISFPCETRERKLVLIECPLCARHCVRHISIRDQIKPSWSTATWLYLPFISITKLSAVLFVSCKQNSHRIAMTLCKDQASFERAGHLGFPDPA